MRQEHRGAGSTAVLLASDPYCRSTISAALLRSGIGVTATATSIAAAHALLEEHRPSLLVADLDLPEGSGAALCMIASGIQARPRLAVVVLSTAAEQELVDAAFEAGASAFILKATAPHALSLAIGLAVEPVRLNGSAATLDGTLASAATAAAGTAPRLTRRELEILCLVSEGRSNREVGQLLWVSDQTVKFHLANIYRKLGVGSRYEAAHWAREQGLVGNGASTPAVGGPTSSNGHIHPPTSDESVSGSSFASAITRAREGTSP